MKNVSVQQALAYVAEHPELETDELIQVPVWQLVAHSLYEVANTPDTSVRGALARANKARKIILDRAVGKRRPGTLPVSTSTESIDMVDLTKAGVLG